MRRACIPNLPSSVSSSIPNLPSVCIFLVSLCRPPPTLSQWRRLEGPLRRREGQVHGLDASVALASGRHKRVAAASAFTLPELLTEGVRFGSGCRSVTGVFACVCVLTRPRDRRLAGLLSLDGASDSSVCPRICRRSLSWRAGFFLVFVSCVSRGTRREGSIHVARPRGLATHRGSRFGYGRLRERLVVAAPQPRRTAHIFFNSLESSRG